MLSAAEIEDIKRLRRRARTDLEYLCHLIDMDDIDRAVHDDMLSPLESIFAGCQGTDVVRPDGTCAYVPAVSDMSVATAPSEPREYLFLRYRGSFKTSINIIAHTIQSLLNFPHSAHLIYHNAENRAIELLREIQRKFTRPAEDEPRVNRLIQLFPEFALEPTVRDTRKYSTRISFTTPARSRVPCAGRVPLEASVTVSALETSQAGRHVDSIKFSDIVELHNSGSQLMLDKTYQQLITALNLKKDPYAFVMVEGTHYAPYDAYRRIIDREWFGVPANRRKWYMSYCPAYKKAWGGLTPDALEAPFEVAKQDIVLSAMVTIPRGKRVPHWPLWRDGRPKFDNEALEKLERLDPFVFACQQLLDPTSAKDRMSFEASHYREMPYEAVERLKFTARIVAIDTAQTTGRESDFTAMVALGVTATGMMVVYEARCDRIAPEDLAEAIMDFAESAKKPDVVLIENTGFVQAFRVLLDQEQQRRAMYLPIEYVQPQTAVRKDERIRGALRGVFAHERLKWSSALDAHVKTTAKNQIAHHPLGDHDDLLDALSRAASSEYVPALGPRPESVEVKTEREHRDYVTAVGAYWREKIFGENELESRNDSNFGV